MRVVLVDPAAFTLPYDHHLAQALAARGVEVELVTSPFRFGQAPAPGGYARRELFYPASSRLFGRSRLRLPLRGVEHVAGLVRLRSVSCDVLHVQWAPLPQVDLRLLRFDRPSVMTAHDILPRRTASKPDLWRRLYDRFSRVVVHSAAGQTRLIDEVGVSADRVSVIPHPVFPGRPIYRDGTPTILVLGLIQPYKQLDHAIAVARALGVRLVVAGDPTYDLGALLDEPGVDWRLGYRPDSEIDEILAETTVALFPYRAELDQSGALLRALGAGVPAVAYDVGGIAEPVRRFAAGAAVPPDDREALTEATRRLLAGPAELERARSGARQAAAELTWEASGDAHLRLYETLVG